MRRLYTLIPLLFLCCLPNTSYAASLFVSPPDGVYEVGDQIRLQVMVSSSEAPLNALSGTLSFPSSLFSVQSISKSGSVLNFWVTEPTFSSTSGTVQFEGVSLSGFQGGRGTVITVVLRALKVGAGTIVFQSGQVLANDGQGTDITEKLSGGTFQIQAAKIKAQPEPVITEPEVKIESPEIQTLAPPIIVLEERNGVPTIVGSSEYVQADVLLMFVPTKGSKLFVTGTVGTDGFFEFPVPQALRNGAYAVSANVVLKNGAQSYPSNILTVEIGTLLTPEITWQEATYVSIFAIIILLTFAGYLLSRRHFNSPKKVKMALRKEVKEAEEVLHKSFALLDQDLTDHMKSGRSTKLDSKEREDIASLKRDLKDAEGYIDKEIKDIGHVYGDNEKES